MSFNNIAIIGDGGWGTTLAILLSKKGYSVSLWGAFPDYIEVMKYNRENVKFLPGIKVPEEIHITSSMEEVLDGKELVVVAAPSQFLRGVVRRFKMYPVSGKAFVSVSKGIENKTLKRMSEVILEELPDAPLAVLSGPTIALEIANGVPSTAVVASRERALTDAVRDVFMTDYFRIYTNSDIAGVEIGGAIKNIVAIAAGLSDGLGFGTNAKAALLTRGLVEIVRLGTAMGASRETFYGLSGLGDLTTTCMSSYSRNRWLGEEIAKGKKLADVTKETEMVVEGVATCKSAYELSKRYKVDMPITREIHNVLYENKNPREAVRDLMTRSPKAEEGAV